MTINDVCIAIAEVFLTVGILINVFFSDELDESAGAF